jgi:hypothetical protein
MAFELYIDIRGKARSFSYYHFSGRALLVELYNNNITY